MVASFNPATPLHINLILSGSALFAWLLLPDPQIPYPLQRRSWEPRQSFRGGDDWVNHLSDCLGHHPTVALGAGRSGASHLPTLYGRNHPLFNVFDGVHAWRHCPVETLKENCDAAMDHAPPEIAGAYFYPFIPQTVRTGDSNSSGLAFKARNLSGLSGDVGGNMDLASWMESSPGNLSLFPGHNADEMGAKDSIRTKVLRAGFNEGMVVMPGETSLLRIRAGSLETDEVGELLPPLFSNTEAYGMINRRNGDVIDAGAASPQLLKTCLLTPAGTDQRVRALATKLANEAPGAAERIQHTLRYLQQECHYSLEVGTFRSRDPVAEFLFEKKDGGYRRNILPAPLQFCFDCKVFRAAM